MGHMGRKSATRSTEATIAGFMASHEGVASRWELEALGLGLGLGRDAITKRARSGRLHRVHQGVYALHSSLTSLARTLLDVAEVVPHRILIAAIDRAEELRILDLNQVQAVLDAHPHRHGAAKLTKAIAEYAQEPVLRSILERDFLALCEKHDLPTPHANRSLGPYEADFHWPEHRLIVETDGRAHHQRRRPVHQGPRARCRTARAGLAHRALHLRPGDPRSDLGRRHPAPGAHT